MKNNDNPIKTRANAFMEAINARDDNGALINKINSMTSQVLAELVDTHLNPNFNNVEKIALKDLQEEIAARPKSPGQEVASIALAKASGLVSQEEMAKAEERITAINELGVKDAELQKKAAEALKERQELHHHNHDNKAGEIKQELHAKVTNLTDPHPDPTPGNKGQSPNKGKQGAGVSI